MTLKDRQIIIDKMIADYFCTHYPGYVCDKDWLKDTAAVCGKCINSWFIREGISNIEQLKERGINY